MTEPQSHDAALGARVEYRKDGPATVWEPNYRPQLRPLEAFSLEAHSNGTVGLRDPSRLSDAAITVSPLALQVLVSMDGTRTCEEIRESFSAEVDQPLPVDTLQAMLAQLDEAHFLAGEAFEAYYESLLTEYRRQAIRRLPSFSALDVLDESGTPYNEMLNGTEPATLSGRIAGLVAPHLDYPRGEPCYVKAYGVLKSRPVPDRVVILGTNHFGRSAAVVTTANAFETPLGVTHTDVSFIERLEEACGDLRTFELDHAAEHSVELQVGWLQHLFGADSFEMVSFLCPDPCGPTGTAPYDGHGVDLRDFALALQRAIADDRRDTLLVAGADLSHVGSAFGDEQRLDEAFLSEVCQGDEGALQALQQGGAEPFRRHLADRSNLTRVCSAGCIYTLATALPDAPATVLGYHQAVDQSTQTCVTCTAIAYTRTVT